MCTVFIFTLLGCATPNVEDGFSKVNDVPTTETDLSSDENVSKQLSEEVLPNSNVATATENNNSSTETNEEPSCSEEPEEPRIPPANEEVEENTDTLLRCTANSLYVRKGAGTSYAVLGSLDKGDMVMPIRKTGDWYEVWYLGASGYVSASYLTEVTFDKGSDKIEQVITEGKKLLGIPYVYGAQRYHFGNGSPNSKFDGKSYDCSSLMQYIFKVGANVNLAMTSREQSLQGKEIPRNKIQRGDLLFFTNSSRVNKTGLERIGHVALYLGDNIILHTASDHAVIEPISDLRNSYFVTARRLVD